MLISCVLLNISAFWPENNAKGIYNKLILDRYRNTRLNQTCACMLLVYVSLDELFVHTNSLKFTPEQTYGTEAIQCYRQTNCKVESMKLLPAVQN